MRNKFVYSCSVKICALGFNKLLESILCLLLVVEVFSLQKLAEMLEEVVVCWQEVKCTWRMRQNFVTQFVKLCLALLDGVGADHLTEHGDAVLVEEHMLGAAKADALGAELDRLRGPNTC